MTRVIVVEDDEALRMTIGKYLTKAGMDVRCCSDAESLFVEMVSDPADVVVLDVNLPGENGFTAAQRLRQRSAVGIIFLTGRARGDDRVQGRTSGADIYLTKPVHLQELELAIANLGWRVTQATATRRPAPSVPTAATANAWEFDRSSWSLIAPGGVRVSLTTAEFRIVSMLMATPGETVPREQILSGLGKTGDIADTRSLDIVLSRLRKKVAQEAGIAPPIKAVRSVGYVFAAPVGGDAATP